jgi:hypothetical protein
MTHKWLSRLRHLLLGPGRHHRKRPEPARITPEQFRLMFSGQSADAKRWPHKLGIEREYRYL